MMEYVSFIIEFMIRVNNYLYIVIEQYVQGSIIKILSIIKRNIQKSLNNSIKIKFHCLFNNN